MANLRIITEVNALEAEEFDEMFGNVIELCKEAAVHVRKHRPFDSVEQISELFSKYLDDLREEEKVNILKLHPDLAGKLASQGKLTAESTAEQRSAGLHALTPDEKNTIDTNNERYKLKFGFPFIICARENKVHSIIEGLKSRYNNTREQEINIAINEVKKICKLRITDVLKEFMI